MLIQRLALITALLVAGLASVFADDIPVDPNLVAIISDVHVGVNPNKPDYAAVPEVKLQRVIDKILAMNPRPALVLNYGDISYNDGNKIDYEIVKPILSRLDEAGIPWVTTFGNHDLREVFWSVFPEKRGVEEFPERLVTVAETDRAFFILLDSLEVGNVSTHPDPEQLKWLDEKLTSLEPTGKRVYVGAHHLIEEFGVAEILKKHPNAAGYIFGHAHHWLCQPIDG
ncbi:MAG: metallophosphoesterase, partial [Thermoguttaceae bacterium]|nr:metallophosphoesterase [Thermoguttaceae bacterium]